MYKEPIRFNQWYLDAMEDNKESFKLWVDDIREPNGEWVWAKNVAEAMAVLENVEVSEISLDHDLGPTEEIRPLVLWMLENEMVPDIVRVHTSNPVGATWIMDSFIAAGYSPVRTYMSDLSLYMKG